MWLDNPNIKRIVIVIAVTGSLNGLGSTQAQDSKVPERNRGPLQLKETEITGKFRDVLGSLKLLETEIVGTVERPQMNDSLPWKDPVLSTVVCEFKNGCLLPGTEPDPLLSEEKEVQGGYLEEIYTPLDKERYSREIRAVESRSGP